jgi:hypothetical protein
VLAHPADWNGQEISYLVRRQQAILVHGLADTPLRRRPPLLQ